MACVAHKRSLPEDSRYPKYKGKIKRRRIDIPCPQQPFLNFEEISSFPSVPTAAVADQILTVINDELKRLPRRSTVNTKTENSFKELTSSYQELKNSNLRNAPLFTFEQVKLIGDRMLKEREQEIRQNYDQVLAQKLNEQYDLFVTFSHSQLQKHAENQDSSYYS